MRQGCETVTNVIHKQVIKNQLAVVVVRNDCMYTEQHDDAVIAKESGLCCRCCVICVIISLLPFQ